MISKENLSEKKDEISSHLSEQRVFPLSLMILRTQFFYQVLTFSDDILPKSLWKISSPTSAFSQLGLKKSWKKINKMQKNSFVISGKKRLMKWELLEFLRTYIRLLENFDSERVMDKIYCYIQKKWHTLRVRLQN